MNPCACCGRPLTSPDCGANLAEVLGNVPAPGLSTCDTCGRERVCRPRGKPDAQVNLCRECVP